MSDDAALAVFRDLQANKALHSDIRLPIPSIAVLLESKESHGIHGTFRVQTGFIVGASESRQVTVELGLGHGSIIVPALVGGVTVHGRVVTLHADNTTVTLQF